MARARAPSDQPVVRRLTRARCSPVGNCNPRGEPCGKLDADRLDRQLREKAVNAGGCNDSDALDTQLAKRGITLISRNREGRRQKLQGRRYRRRWMVERFFAWLFAFRKLVTRDEVRAANFFGFLQIGWAIVASGSIYEMRSNTALSSGAPECLFHLEFVFQSSDGYTACESVSIAR
jgi:hypothetical protein